MSEQREQQLWIKGVVTDWQLPVASQTASRATTTRRRLPPSRVLPSHPRPSSHARSSLTINNSLSLRLLPRSPHQPSLHTVPSPLDLHQNPTSFLSSPFHKLPPSHAINPRSPLRLPSPCPPTATPIEGRMPISDRRAERPSSSLGSEGVMRLPRRSVRKRRICTTMGGGRGRLDRAESTRVGQAGCRGRRMMSTSAERAMMSSSRRCSTMKVRHE